QTPAGARTMDIDRATSTIYLRTAEFEPAKSGHRPSAKSDTFKIVLVRKSVSWKAIVRWSVAVGCLAIQACCPLSLPNVGRRPTKDMKSTFSRRGFLFGAAAFPFLAPLRLRSEQVLHRQTIKNLQCMVLSGERTYVFVKITASDGTYGIGEAYGSPSVGTKEQILELKPSLVGKDPLGIDAIYSELGRGANSLSGTRTDGSAHNLVRAASGIEMALWDLAGK